MDYNREIEDRRWAKLNRVVRVGTKCTLVEKGRFTNGYYNQTIFIDPQHRVKKDKNGNKYIVVDNNIIFRQEDLEFDL